MQVVNQRVPTMPNPGVHDSTVIVTVNVGAQYRGQASPVTGREVRPERLEDSDGSAVHSWRRPAEFVEPRERRVEICLVVELTTVDQFALDRGDADDAPLGVESL